MFNLSLTIRLENNMTTYNYFLGLHRISNGSSKKSNLFYVVHKTDARNHLFTTHQLCAT